MKKITEATIENVALEYFGELGYEIREGPELAHDGSAPERTSYGDVVLDDRLLNSLRRINPDVPAEAIDETLRKLTRSDSPSLYLNNHQFHTFLIEGVAVEYQGKDGRVIHDTVRVIDFDEPGNNDWLAVNQFTVIEHDHHRRPDVVVFVNGLPIGVIELKNVGDEKATIKGAYNQLQTYKEQIPSLFQYNEVLVVSDGVEARSGSLTANWDRFMPWRTIDGKKIAPKGSLELEVLLKGIFEKKRLLDIIRYFTVFEIDKAQVIKKVAAYHQYYAVNHAVKSAVKAISPKGDRRAGVVWHTQGSGKSLSMVFFAGKAIQHPSMENPTFVVITDRNDLDDQLFGTFASSHELLRQKPEQAENRAGLKKALKRASGGIVFTTIQKFFPGKKNTKMPLLSDRRNIIVIADEAHRSQYGFIDGFARHMHDALPNASFIGFTGTPIEADDRNTRAVFGDYIDVYDIQRAVEDKATVPIYYEGRLAQLDLAEDLKPAIDAEFEEITEDEEEAIRSRLKSKWARQEAVVGAEHRIELVAKDIVEHFEKRQEVLEGKGLIVCLSRRIAVDLYGAIVKLRPQWGSKDDKKGFLKVVMTGSASDELTWQKHIRNKDGRDAIAKRFKDEKDSLKLVIVRDMWLTGFDVPSLHTMYIDKPMRGHGLMQAIARVNRVFKDKPGGLVVDYIGIADQLKRALMDYSAGDRHLVGIDQDEAVAALQSKIEVLRNLMHGFDYMKFFDAPDKERLALIPQSMEHVLTQDDGKKRFMQAVVEMSTAFALSVPHEEALELRDEVGFFQTLRAAFVKNTPVDRKTAEELDAAVRQIISRAISSNEVLDIFSAAGLSKPDISVFSDEFLAEVKNLPQKNLAIEALSKLLKNAIKTHFRTNVVKERAFSEMLEQSIKRYQNRAIEAAQIIEELIELAKELKSAEKQSKELGLSEDEVSFYDALADNGSAREAMGDKQLMAVARVLVERVKNNLSVDWSVREAVRAKLRIMVKRILREYGYPPDLQETATSLVLEQAERLSQHWIK